MLERLGIRIPIKGFTKNQLKVIAAICMTIDHIGVELFPQVILLRMIGRIAFPIFAYAVYEGCRYTHNKGKYLLRIFALGMLCLLGYYLYSGEIYANVLLTFSLSTVCIYSLQFVEKACCEKKMKTILLSMVLLAGSIVCSFAICKMITVDYGFAGVMLPVAAQICYLLGKVWKFCSSKYGKQMKAVSDKIYEKLPLIGFAVGLLVLAAIIGGIQYVCLLSLLILAAANGKNGVWRMKYFFYGFYPIHLVLIGVISVLC